MSNAVLRLLVLINSLLELGLVEETREENQSTSYQAALDTEQGKTLAQFRDALYISNE